MLEKIKNVEQRFRVISAEMARPEIAADPDRYTQLAREYAELEPVVKKGREYQNILAMLEESRQILQDSDDEELREMAREELAELEGKESRIRQELQLLLVPPDPTDSKHAIVEIRAGTGGDEAGIFAGDLFRMYQKFCETMGWKTELLSANSSERGGFKEVIFSVEGKGAYGELKFESGVHRVQRVPETETQGRVHTSAASVVVMPEVEDVEINIDPNDLRIDVFRASGHGGQHVNTTDSAVRIVHIPTGITATCQDEKSQLKNKNKALKVLKARIFDVEMRKRQQEISNQRRSFIRGGDRSEKIRTYNFPQSRVTDHRINLTLYRLEEILQGDLAPLIEKLKLAELSETLKESEKIKTDG